MRHIIHATQSAADFHARGLRAAGHRAFVQVYRPGVYVVRFW